MGANVVIVEIDPIRALEAAMDGFRVMTSLDAAEAGDLFITATGALHVFGGEHFRLMRDGAILANAGHFNVEIDIPALEALAAEQREARPFTREYRLADGRRIYLLADGRLVNLAAAEGHPSLVMDLSFANQALGVEWISQHHDELEPQVYEIPVEIDREVARLKLASMGIAIDRPTAEQEAYATSWQQGT
jgi:adenosylhomocysteinase